MKIILTCIGLTTFILSLPLNPLIFSQNIFAAHNPTHTQITNQCDFTLDPNTVLAGDQLAVNVTNAVPNNDYRIEVIKAYGSVIQSNLWTGEFAETSSNFSETIQIPPDATGGTDYIVRVTYISGVDSAFCGINRSDNGRKPLEVQGSPGVSGPATCNLSKSQVSTGNSIEVVGFYLTEGEPYRVLISTHLLGINSTNLGQLSQTTSIRWESNVQIPIDIQPGQYIIKISGPEGGIVCKPPAGQFLTILESGDSNNPNNPNNPNERIKMIPLPQGPAGLSAKGFTGENLIGKFVEVILPIILGIGGFITVIFIIISGIQFMLSSGNPEAAAAARGRLTMALVGFTIILLAIALTQIIDKIFLGSSGIF